MAENKIQFSEMSELDQIKLREEEEEQKALLPQVSTTSETTY